MKYRITETRYFTHTTFTPEVFENGGWVDVFVFGSCESMDEARRAIEKHKFVRTVIIHDVP